jgi:hypothetical protein
MNPPTAGLRFGFGRRLAQKPREYTKHPPRPGESRIRQGARAAKSRGVQKIDEAIARLAFDAPYINYNKFHPACKVRKQKINVS